VVSPSFSKLQDIGVSHGNSQRPAFLAPIPANVSWLPDSSEPGIEIYSLQIALTVYYQRNCGHRNLSKFPLGE